MTFSFHSCHFDYKFTKFCNTAWSYCLLQILHFITIYIHKYISQWYIQKHGFGQLTHDVLITVCKKQVFVNIYVSMDLIFFLVLKNLTFSLLDYLTVQRNHKTKNWKLRFETR